MWLAAQVTHRLGFFLFVRIGSVLSELLDKVVAQVRLLLIASQLILQYHGRFALDVASR